MSHNNSCFIDKRKSVFLPFDEDFLDVVNLMKGRMLHTHTHTCMHSVPCTKMFTIASFIMVNNNDKKQATEER